MDGSEDHLLGQVESDQEESVDFEGFEQDDVDIAQDVLENVACELSEGSASDVDSDGQSESETECDYDSPGH